jgi:hypothetical protein
MEPHTISPANTSQERMSPIFPDCYDEWRLYRVIYDGDHKMYDTLYEGTEEQCRQYAYDNYTDKEQTDMILMDWEGREWEV